jgi:CheY-like chemotaxis protein
MSRGDETVVIIASDDAALFEWPAGPGVAFRRTPLSPDVQLADCAVFVVDGVADPTRALAIMRAVRTRHGDAGPPIIFLAPADFDERLQSFENGADACLVAPVSDEELNAQLRAFARWHDSRAQLRRRAEEAHQFNHRLQQAYDQINLDLDMAGRLQASFLPKTLPEVGRVRFAAHYKPLGPVGGDFYDFEVMESGELIATLADVSGKGVAASLLSSMLLGCLQLQLFDADVAQFSQAQTTGVGQFEHGLIAEASGGFGNLRF